MTEVRHGVFLEMSDEAKRAYAALSAEDKAQVDADIKAWAEAFKKANGLA